MSQYLQDDVETLIDEHGLTKVVDAIIQVCYEKTDYIRASYSDESLADAWRKAGVQLANLQEHTPFPS